ncbi:hypothetical protein LTR85_007797 [Meristemomyces frigidus]|nr:hypothetical protein LTR85_007797 [Meristemomyces frigidus]
MPGDMWDEQDEDDYGMPIKRNDGTSRWSPRRFRRSGPIVGALLLLLLWWKAGLPSSGTDWSRYAYVSYATDDHNMCNAFMVFEALDRLGSKADRVLLHNPEWASVAQGGQDRNSQLMTLAAKQYNVKLKPVRLLDERGEATRGNSKGFSSWDTSITKLRAFELTEYDRVLSLDSDITLFQHMDELFLLSKAAVAMPRAYWSDTPPEQWPFTSLMMLLEPNPAELKGLLDTLHSWRMDPAQNRSKKYDMELMNHRFGSSAMVLPHRPYALLSAEFRRHDHSAYLGSTGAPDSEKPVWNAEEVLQEAKLVHFSDWPLPKPWVMWPHDAVSEIQPDCDMLDVGNYQYSCREREIWKDLYNDFRRRRKEHCKLLSVAAPNWSTWKESVGAA